jgi:hypothetical protein
MNSLHRSSLHFHLTLGAVIFGMSMTVIAVTPEPAPKEESRPLPVEQLTEAEMVQQVISHHLVNAENDQATERTEQMSIVVGDVRRTVGLSP